jgi:dihydropyrimidinase
MKCLAGSGSSAFAGKCWSPGRLSFNHVTMLITNGTLIHREGPQQADLLVEAHKILAVLPAGQAEPESGQAVIDASGLWVLPGAVDAHTHFGMPLRGGISSLGWRESSAAALLGGTTCVIDFANPERDEPLPAAVARWRQMADQNILCDYGLHCTVTEAAEDRLAEIPGLIAAGIPTFKGFLAYKGRLMLEPAAMGQLMGAVREAGGLLLVHAEDGEMNARAQDVLLNAGRIGPRYHPLAHPAESETAAVAAVLDMAVATGCSLLVVHMSLARSVQLLAEARAANPEAAGRLLGEVCLHHLLAQDGLYDLGHEPALAAICSPPLRPAGDCDGLQEALIAGQVDLLSTDHCEFPLAVKAEAAAGGFHLVPNGCGGVGERLVFSHTHLVTGGRLTPGAWVDAVATRPAEIMGLQDRKGRLAPGYDADIVLFDPAARYSWEPLDRSDRPGSLWAGQPVTGAVRDVWLRGRQVVQGGRLVIDQPGGIFLPRQL